MPTISAKNMERARRSWLDLSAEFGHVPPLLTRDQQMLLESLARDARDLLLRTAPLKVPLKNIRDALKSTKPQRDREERARTKAVRKTLKVRCGGKCECGCGIPMKPGTEEMDHFRGGAHRETTVENCWMLWRPHHQEKTANHPDAASWRSKYRVHLRRQGYEVPEWLA